jgi:hypothetical protein
MPNGYDYTKEYGPHDYPSGEDGTADCRNGCGCSAGNFTSHGPLGLDPLGGECPGNPKDGKLVGGKADYDIVVTRRIRRLESDLLHATLRVTKLESLVDPSKEELADGMAEALKKVSQLQGLAEDFAIKAAAI